MTEKNPSETEFSNNNPLLVEEGYPRFDQIRAEHVVPAMKVVLERCSEELVNIEQNIQPSWGHTIGALEKFDIPFEYSWSAVSHLFGVRNSPELRKVYEAVQGDVVQFSLRVGQSVVIYQALKELQSSDIWSSLSEPQQRIVEQRIVSAELAGVGLQGEERSRFNEIAQRLSELSTTFSNNVLDATKAFSLTITDPNDIEGMPESLLQLASDAHNKSQETEDSSPAEGPWRFTLEIPLYVPFMKHCRNRSLREEMYRAFTTRGASDEYDNTPLITEILKLRQEQAELLEFRNYAEVSLARKMAPDVNSVLEMLETLRAASWDPAQKDLEDLRELSRSSGQSESLAHWDISFWSERLQEARFDFTDEQLRPYFPMERVLEGLFSLVQRLFGVEVRATDQEAPVWHPDVRFFSIHNEEGERIAAFYLDPYSRPEDKRSGAWMDECLNRRWKDETLQVPVAHLVCNGTPPVGDKPSLMTFREVETLFHEFGHGLHHMLTRVDFPDAAGINGVEWDAVELPSQFMENWCYHKPTLLGMTAHFETGEPLPEVLFEKLVAARTFQSGMHMLRQLLFGITDMELHSRFDPNGTETVFEVQQRISEKTSVLPMLPENRMLCSFQHIFAGGYAAGYYSYKWAEVLSADAFSAFEDAGLDNEQAVQETGRRFRETILAKGGSEHPMTIFQEFRGRKPSPQALLRHNDLV